MPENLFVLLFVAFAQAAFAGSGVKLPTLDGKHPLIVAHRGAGGYLPEETYEAYVRAIDLGADVIEPDLIMTKDHALIARHDPNLAISTNVASLPQFANRKTKRNVDGEIQEGWFAADFTLAEIRTLGGIVTDPERSKDCDGKCRLVTFQEIIDLAKSRSTTKRKIWIYPESKNPTYNRELGLPLEDSIIAVLCRAGWNRHDAPVFVQSFEPSSLKYMRAHGLKTQVIQLIGAHDIDLRTGKLVYALPDDRPYDWTRAGDTTRTFEAMTTSAGLAEIRTYADGIGPWKLFLIPLRAKLDSAGKPIDQNQDGKISDADGFQMTPTSLVADAHRAGLVVHPYTFRNEKRRIPADFHGDPKAELKSYFRIGVDAVFTDFTDTALSARREWLAETGR
jgi:glycerophosphoryl diester phosphodiesterase